MLALFVISLAGGPMGILRGLGVACVVLLPVCMVASTLISSVLLVDAGRRREEGREVTSLDVTDWAGALRLSHYYRDVLRSDIERQRGRR